VISIVVPPSMSTRSSRAAKPADLPVEQASKYKLVINLKTAKALGLNVSPNHLYGGMDEPEIKIIDVFICKLRKKLANASDGKDYIETVWGRGYVLREPSEDDRRIFA
jgi:DNA-binding response OmpR family regulator